MSDNFIHTPQGQFIRTAQFLDRSEFQYPQFMDVSLLRGLEQTRQWLGRPMYFTQYQGIERHPNGDAVPETSTAHSVGSLHKYRIRDGRMEYGLAQDWDCKVSSREELWEVYLLLERANIWTGIGLYPFWINRGFHTDLRPRSHPYWGARWIRDQHGVYHKLTWPNVKRIMEL